MIDPLPELDRTASTFKTDCDNFFGTLLPAFSVQVEAARLAIIASEEATEEAAAAAAADAVQTALDRVATGLNAVQTAADRIAVAGNAASVLNMDKRYLGAKSVPPTLDNQGAALQAGAVYYDTVLLGVYTWTGSAWVLGISSISGVASLNGSTGAVTIKTVGGVSLMGAGNVAIAAPIGSLIFLNQQYGVF